MRDRFAYGDVEVISYRNIYKYIVFFIPIESRNVVILTATSQNLVQADAFPIWAMRQGLRNFKIVPPVAPSSIVFQRLSSAFCSFFASFSACFVPYSHPIAVMLRW